MNEPKSTPWKRLGFMVLVLGFGAHGVQGLGFGV